MTAMQAVAVFVGGGLGSVARWVVGEMCARWWPTVPAGTLAVTMFPPPAGTAPHRQ